MIFFKLEYRIGVRLCCENHFFCGKCYQCSHDQHNICQNLNQYGHGKGTMHGGCSQFSIIPARYAYLLQTNLDLELACLMEPLAVAHQGELFTFYHCFLRTLSVKQKYMLFA